MAKESTKQTNQKPIDKNYRWANSHWYYMMPGNHWMVYEKDHWVKTNEVPQESAYPPAENKSGTGATSGTSGAANGGGDCAAAACGCASLRLRDDMRLSPSPSSLPPLLLS